MDHTHKHMHLNGSLEMSITSYLHGPYTQAYEPEWITRDINNLLGKQKKLYTKYRLNGFKSDDKVNVDRIRDECFQAITTSKQNYLKCLDNKLIDKVTGPKNYWSIINVFVK